MMMTSSCSSRSAERKASSWILAVLLSVGGPAAHAAGPLSFPGVEGDVRQKVNESGKSWTSSWSEIPLAASIRVSVHSVTDCASARKSFQDWKPGEAFSMKKPDWSAWGPWTPEDREALVSCRKSPCKVKLNPAEAGALATMPRDPDKRRERYIALVLERVKGHERAGKRSGYEYPGPLVDPHEWFGLKSQLITRVSSESLRLRKLDFAPGQFRAIRQVLEQETYLLEGVVRHVIRDIYTAHYFDGWGERLEGECLSPQLFRLSQLLFMEVDLFKKTDAVSKLARPRLKRELTERSQKYFESREALLVQ